MTSSYLMLNVDTFFINIFGKTHPYESFEQENAVSNLIQNQLKRKITADFTLTQK